MNAPSEKTIFTVSCLYRQLLDQADQLLANCKDRTLEDKKRDQYRSKAWLIHITAGHLAHTIARFGDLDILQADLDPLEEEIQKCSCAGTNPWFRALRYIRQERARVLETRQVLQDEKEGKMIASTPISAGSGAWNGQQVKEPLAHLDRMLGNRRSIILCRVSEHQLRVALHHCATKPLLKFCYYRLTTGTDWVSEHRRFAFGREPS